MHPTILFVGRQFHRKVGDLLVEAFRRVRERIPEARLMIAGPPSRSNRSQGSPFSAISTRDDPSGWAALVAAYGSADVFCLPTRFEPFGIAFIEAIVLRPALRRHRPLGQYGDGRDGEQGLRSRLMTSMRSPSACSGC